MNDLRYALRQLRRNPGFTVVAVGTLALGIGATTAIFSVVRAVLLEPLPYAHPDRLVMVWNPAEGEGGTTWLSGAEVTSYQQENESFQHVAAFDLLDTNLTGGSEPERVRAAAVTANTFEALGVGPLIGRTLAPSDGEPDVGEAVVIGHGLWQRAFGGAADVIGRTIRVDGLSRTVVGVMPASFRLPLDYREERPTELWLPLALDAADPGPWGDRSLIVFGLLREGVTATHATTELARIAEGWIRQGFVADEGNRGLFRSAVSLQEFVTGGARRSLLVLFGAVGFVLIIACANVANLLLVRADGRRREVAVRGALGAGRRRVVGQLLIESVSLSVAGGGLGLAAAVAGTRLLAALRLPGLPRVEKVEIDLATLAFAAGLALLTALAFGLAPAFQLARTDLAVSLKEGERRGTAGRARQRFRRGLVVIETAVSVILLVGAGLLLRSVAELRRLDLGFDSDRVLTMRVTPTQAEYPESSDIVAFYRELLDRVRELPGVQTAAAVRVLPLSDTIGDWSITIEGVPFRPEDNANGGWQVVTDGYFETMGLELVRGRVLTSADREDEPLSVVINDTMAAQYWPGEDPVGKRFHLGTADQPWLTVVGVVRPVRHNAVVEEPRREMYLPHAQLPAEVRFAPYGMTLVVKTAGDPLMLSGPVRALVRTLNPDLPVAEIRSMNQVVVEAQARPRFTAQLLGLFAAMALALAAIGIYGILSLLVAQRSRELGIRLALGAEARRLAASVVGQGVRLTLVGITAGALAALALSRLLGGLLFGVSFHDPLTYVGVAIVLAGVAAVASWIPARRAMRVDPMSVLKEE